MNSGEFNAQRASVWAIIVPAIAGLLAGFGGAFFASWLTRRNDVLKQRLDFAAQQIRELYSSLLGSRTHIVGPLVTSTRFNDVAKRPCDVLRTDRFHHQFSAAKQVSL